MNAFKTNGEKFGKSVKRKLKKGVCGAKKSRRSSVRKGRGREREAGRKRGRKGGARSDIVTEIATTGAEVVAVGIEGIDPGIGIGPEIETEEEVEVETTNDGEGVARVTAAAAGAADHPGHHVVTGHVIAVGAVVADLAPEEALGMIIDAGHRDQRAKNVSKKTPQQIQSPNIQSHENNS